MCIRDRVKEADYHAADGLKPIIDRYLAADYNMDQQYRKFYYYYDQLESTESFEPVSYTHLDVYKRQPLPRWRVTTSPRFRDVSIHVFLCPLPMWTLLSKSVFWIRPVSYTHLVGGSESNVWKLYESIMCIYFDMEEIIKQAVYLQGAYDRERMLKWE